VYNVQITDYEQKKVITGKEYVLHFKNEEYAYLTDIKHVTFGNKEDYKDFVNKADSLLYSHENMSSGETISYNMKYFKITIYKCISGPCIKLYSDDGLGFVFLNRHHVDKLKSIE
jgi:hypothetical protein